jgi:valyl-tRNA synthetase
MVPRGDRTNAVIEPYMTDQWFVKVAPLAQPAIDADAIAVTTAATINFFITYSISCEKTPAKLQR